MTPYLLPIADDDQTACRFDPELHTGPDAFETETDEQRAAREDVAREVCSTCSVRGACLAYALDIRPAHGIYAGHTAAEIAELADSLATIRGAA
jgi:WhiB family transcriptional regulator, redox-sensing transcriptional regulator